MLETSGYPQRSMGGLDGAVDTYMAEQAVIASSDGSLVLDNDVITSQRAATGMGTQTSVRFDRPGLPAAQDATIPHSNPVSAMIQVMKRAMGGAGTQEIYKELLSSIDPDTANQISQLDKGDTTTGNTATNRDMWGDIKSKERSTTAPETHDAFNTVMAKDYLTLVSSALRSVRGIIQEILKQEAKYTQDNREGLRDQHEQLADELRKQINNMIKQNKAEKKQNIGFNIGGTHINLGSQKDWLFASGIVVGALITVFTLGTGAAAGAMIAAAIIFAATTALTAYDTYGGGKISDGMTKMVSSLTNLIDKGISFEVAGMEFSTGGGVDNKLASKIIAGILITLVIVAVVLATKGQASDEMVTAISYKSSVSAAAAVSSANAVKMVAVQSSMQYAMTLMITANLVGEICLGIGKGLEELGIPIEHKKLEMAAMVLNVIIVAIACTIACAKGYGPAMNEAALGVKMTNTMNRLMTAVTITSASTNALVNLKEADHQWKLAKIEIERGDIEAAIVTLRKGIAKMMGIDEQTLQQVQNALMEAANFTSKKITGMIDGMSGMAASAAAA